MYQILLVDDEVSVVDTLYATLPWEDMGVETVHKAYSGQEALDMLNIHPIDIIITDIRMPEMSGIELSETIRKRWKHKDVIFLTGHSDFTYAKHAIHIQAADYILKPIANEDLIRVIQGVIERRELNQEQTETFQKAVETLQANLPLLRASLLSELLQGRVYTEELLKKKLEMVGLSSDWINGAVALMLVRTEEGFMDLNPYSKSLLKYSVTNIADENFEPYFQLWHGEDSHEYMIVLARPNPETIGAVLGSSLDDKSTSRLLEKLALEWQKNVKAYIKGSISVVISSFGLFPQELPVLYDRCMTGFRKQIGKEQELLFVLPEVPTLSGETYATKGIYEPPMLHHMLENGKWDEAEQKLASIFDQLQEDGPQAAESMLVVYLTVASALSYSIHRNAISFDDVLQKELSRMLQQFRSKDQLHTWVTDMCRLIRSNSEQEQNHSRSSLVNQVQQYIKNNLTQDVSLQAIADHVKLHPAYLSRIYKTETGEGVSDFLYRYRMEEAARLLTKSELKIYKITELLGYQYTPYFIKVFKQYFGITPQEYRNRS